MAYRTAQHSQVRNTQPVVVLTSHCCLQSARSHRQTPFAMSAHLEVVQDDGQFKPPDPDEDASVPDSR